LACWSWLATGNFVKIVVMMRTLQAAALAFLFVPISTVTYQALPRHLNGDGAALFSMFRNVFGSIGISLSIAGVTQRSVSQTYEALIANYEHALGAMGRAGAAIQEVAVGRAYQAFREQVTILTCSDIFYCCATIAFIVVRFCFCSRRRPAAASPAERMDDVADAQEPDGRDRGLRRNRRLHCGPNFVQPDSHLPEGAFLVDDGKAAADGVTEFLTVVDAERSLLQAEQQNATSTTNVSLDLVQLFKALGGGWETPFPDPPSETAAVPVPLNPLNVAIQSAPGYL
jgi:hypothetical protein